MTQPASRAPAAQDLAPDELTPRVLKSWIADGQELAILDVREEGVFSRGHLLLAANAPLWRLEVQIDALVPRRGTRIVVVDGDGSLLAEARERLGELGYGRVHRLRGGTAAWVEAGHEVFSGINLLSKAFGELIEHELHTPNIGVQALREKLLQGEDLLVVDGRTPEEFQRFSIPGAHSLPNGELLYRIAELAPRPDTLVVVNCAGRTRSIVGAQTLINAGIPNRVLALRDGTMAWLHAGYELQRGVADALPEPSPDNLEVARRQAARVAEAAGVRVTAFDEIERLAAQTDRSTYLFDVRSREEYESGHLPGWRWAPGGQLLQATDQYVATRHARVILADWDGVRALTTAAWLAQLGAHEVHVTPVPGGARALRTGPAPRHILVPAAPAPWVSARQLAQWLPARQAEVFDVESSLAFAARHIAGARFCVPDRLPEFVRPAGDGARVVITASDPALARSVATLLHRRTGRDVHALAGGNAAWFALGLPTGSGREAILTGDDDDWYSPYMYETAEERLARMREYLDWEVALAEKVRRDGDAGVRLAPPPR